MMGSKPQMGRHIQTHTHTRKHVLEWSAGSSLGAKSCCRHTAVTSAVGKVNSVFVFVYVCIYACMYLCVYVCIYLVEGCLVRGHPLVLHFVTINACVSNEPQYVYVCVCENMRLINLIITVNNTIGKRVKRLTTKQKTQRKKS